MRRANQAAGGFISGRRSYLFSIDPRTIRANRMARNDRFFSYGRMPALWQHWR